MKRILNKPGWVWLAGLALCLVVPVARAAGEASKQDQRMAWFREAKYGLFIHWGPYAIPAGGWRGRRVPGFGEWIMHHAKIPARDYAAMAAGWNPARFDAEAWVRLASEAGVKYIVITAKHHDGFAMYRSAVSGFNIADGTSFGRDPLRELAEACARHGMRLGFYYSQAQDWHEPGGAGNTWDFVPDAEKESGGAYDRYLREKAEPQVRELLTRYGPVSCIWFDTPELITPERGRRFADLVRELQPECLIDGRLGAAGDYVTTDDNTVPNIRQEGDWETPMTMNHTWGFRSDDRDWKSPTEILFKLADVVSKGGNFLLNVGPDADGVIPPYCADNLWVVGDWLKINGEAVYGAGRSPFGAEFGEFSATRKDRHGAPVFLASTTWRCTTKPGRLYFFYFGDRRSTVELPPFANAIIRAYILGDPERTPCAIEIINGVRTVQVQRQGPHATANVLCLEIEGVTVQPTHSSSPSM
jgi:alpha-L-fucosidase